MTFILAGCLCASCSDFLTENPEHSLTMETSVTNYSGAKNIVNGIYGVYENSCDYLGGYLQSSCHCMAGLWKYSNAMYNMSYTQTSNEGTIVSIWNQFYACINAANAAIIGVTNLPDSEFPSPEAKTALIAEARCFRGYCNLHLLWFFGHWFAEAESPYGILYRDQVSELTNLMVERSTVGESYRLILEDLTYAEQYAPDYESALRMSKQFAQALHAKLLMVRGWEGDYDEALGLVNTLLTKAPAVFQMETDLAQLYEKGWDSKEVLFSRYLGDVSQRTYEDFIYSYGLYYDNEFTDIPQGWLDADERFPIIFGTARAPETWDEKTNDKVLVKLYHRGRYEGPDDMYATYAFRYAELYLMKAELLARTNPSDITGALAPLNEMRAKYTNPVMAPVTGIATHQELMDAIYKEYVVTLLMENETPWFASLRFEKDGKPWIYTLKPEVNFSENQYCWPIPDDEIKAHSNVIEQNPGLK